MPATNNSTTPGGSAPVVPLYPSLPAALLAQSKEHRDRVAVRQFDGERWNEYTWQAYRDNMLSVALGLGELGLEAGDRVAVLSGNSYPFLVCDLACQSLQVATAPIYPNSIPSQVQYVIDHAGCKAIFVEDRSQLQKVLEVWSDCPSLAHVVMLDDTKLEDERIHRYSSLRRSGERQGVPAEQALEEAITAIDHESLATIVYTSGTTGPPKGAMLSHTNLVFEGETISRQFNATYEDSTLSFLPLSHVAERLQGEIIALRMGYTINIGEGVPTVGRDLLMVQPTILLCVPRVWEKMKASVEDALEDAPELRRRIFAWALKVGAACFELRNAQRRVPPWLWVREVAARTLVQDKLRAKMGLARTRLFVSGAAPLSPEVAAFFGALGMPIQEVYGQTECVGVSNFNPYPGVRLGTVGPALDGVEVRIEPESGEILVRSPNVFLGYFRDEEATAKTVVDGWLHTGDVGVIEDDGYLRITDRLKDIIVTAGGKNVAPQNIENKLKGIAGFSQVVVVGDKRRFLSALVTLDRESLQAIWDRKDAGPVPEGDLLCDDREVNRWVMEHVQSVNQKMARYEQIKKIRILAEDFSVDSGELTATLKVKRRVVQDKHKELIDRFYEE